MFPRSRGKEEIKITTKKSGSLTNRFFYIETPN